MFKKKNTETSNLVNSLFNDIAENDEIHNLLKKLFSKLRKPYLKIALKSPNLFAYENHQARIFLQIAEQTSINWYPEYDQTNSYIKTIKSIIKSITKSIKADKYESSNFIKYGKDLDEIIISVNITRKRQLREKQLATEKIEKTKLDANVTITTLLKGKQLPKLVRYIIEEQWENVLVLIHLRHSKQSDKYQQQLNFINLLIEVSLTNKIEQYNKQHCNDLLNEYKKGLGIVAYKAKEIKENTNILSNYLTSLFNNIDESLNKIIHELDDKCLTNSKSNSKIVTKKAPSENVVPNSNVIPNKNIKNNPETSTTSTTSKSANTFQANTSKNSKEKAPTVDYQQIISNLKTGTWFEITDEKNSNTRVKLSWISPVTGKFLFVNSNGLKITDKNTKEFIESLKLNQIRILKSFS